MGSAENKKCRMLEIFFRAMKGENISVKSLADEYGVSGKSISRDIGEIKNFLCDNRELVGNTELKYASSSKSYYLEFDNFLLSKELISIIKILIGCRALNKMELLDIVSKLKNFTSYHDRIMLDKIIAKEMHQYNEVNSDCKSVIDNIWQITRCIYEKIEISVSYYKISRDLVERRIRPVAITFSDYYFYLIAYRCDVDDWKPLYYRMDRIVNIVEHRKHFEIDKEHDFDEGELRQKIQFMFPGEYKKIRFKYTGVSVQAILDKIPTAKVIDKVGDSKIIEAETFGTGVNMFLLSQGTRIKALYPPAFVLEMKSEIQNMYKMYNE
jgi:predicted DNA-binding transcriptional regulator YafY